MDMVRRYFQLEHYLDKDDIDLMPLIPTLVQLRELKSLIVHLNKFASVTKKLQDPSITLSQVRAMFDGMISKYPIMQLHLAADADAAIVQNSALETGIVKLLDGMEDTLTAFEKNAQFVIFLINKLTYNSAETHF